MTDEYLSSAGHWERINVSASALIRDPQKLNLPVIVQDLCRALLDLHKALTAKPCDCARHDAYAAREAEQREAADPDPLDESDHRDRLDADGDRLTRRANGLWSYGLEEGLYTLARADEREAFDQLRIITGAEQTSEALRRAALMEASGVTDDLNAVFSGIAANGALFPMDIIKLDECGVNVQPVLDWIRKEAR